MLFQLQKSGGNASLIALHVMYSPTGYAYSDNMLGIGLQQGWFYQKCYCLLGLKMFGVHF
jgi:hypothetical protein